MRDDSPHILVVDDDERLRGLLARFLREHGYAVSTADSAADARYSLSLVRPDLIVLDIMMPGESGLELAKGLPRQDAPPVLLLSALSETEDRVAGLEVGADDYVSKPFEPKELLLRIQALLRRTRRTPEMQAVVVFGGYMFDIAAQQLRKGTEPIHLTTAETALLSVLAQQAGNPVSREELGRRLSMAAERSVDVQVTRLRRKIEDNSAKPLYIQTVRGAGYVLQGQYRV